MNWILSFSILIMFIISLLSENKCVLNPSCIFSLMFLSTSLIVSINTNYWNYTISWTTFLIIIGSIICFYFGQKFGYLIKRSHVNKRYMYELSAPSKVAYLAVIVFGIVVLVLMMCEKLSNASLVNMVGDLASIIRANRYYVGERGQSNSIIRLSFVIYRAVANVFFALYWFNKENREKKPSIFLTSIILSISFFCSVLTTNRTDIIVFVSYFIFVLAFDLYSKNDWRPRNINRKVTYRMIVIVIVGLICFRLLGYLTGKSNVYSLYDNICIYIGSPIVCFDKYVIGDAKNFPSNYTPQLLSGVASLLNTFGANLETDTLVWPHQYWKNGASNIYTSLFIYYYRFRIIGTLAINMALGLIYGILWKLIKKTSSWVGVLVYGNIFFTYLTMCSIYERFFTHLFTLTTAVEIFTISFVTKRFEIKRI